MDEFYSGYNYTTSCDGTVISAADNILDVNTDDVLILDGLTKRFRLPGWRIAWVRPPSPPRHPPNHLTTPQILGPKPFISALSSSGSYLDGGAAVPFQQAAIPLLSPPARVRTEMAALQTHFLAKRTHVLARLRAMGFPLASADAPPATFYLWLDLAGLPPPIADGLGFLDACLREKVVVVPGIFFDLNPCRRREVGDASPCHRFVRLSYGPCWAVLDRGLDGIERVLRRHGVFGT